MLYRHKKTGVIVDITLEARGDWEPVPVASSSEKKEKTVKKPAKKPTKKK